MAKHRSTPKLGLAALLAALAVGLLIAGWLPATTGTTTAERVLGQSDFGADAAGGGETGLSAPAAIALDRSVNPAHLYVADTGNNRVLGYRDAAALANGAAADLVIGQQNFCATACNAGAKAGAATLCAPAGVAVDSEGNLYVADSGNNRVTEYADPFSALATDQQSAGFIAERVLGQADLTSAGCNRSKGGSGAPTAATLCRPGALAIDGDQRLYVADSGNNRVLGYDRPLEQPAGNLVIGQLDFRSRKCNLGGAPSASSLCIPSGVAADRSGNLYVADQDNHRVLEFDAPRNNGPPAHLVFGQPDPASSKAGGCAGAITNADGLCFPNGIALDGSDSLYVADRGNNRVLDYLNPLAPGAGTQGTSGSASDTTADFVFGQNGSFAATARNGGGTTADSLSQPAGVAVDETGTVYIADTGNNRVLEYNGASVPVSAITPAASPTPESSPCPGVAQGSEQSSEAASNKPVAQASPAEFTVSSGKKLSFGKAVYFASTGGAVVTKKLTITNKTAAAISYTLAIDSSSADASDFTPTDGTCAGTLAAHGKCPFTVAFSPTGLGTRTAILDVADSSTSFVAKVNLTGVSFAGALKFSATSLSFGKEANGSSTKVKNVTVSSTYTIPSTISSVGVFTDKTGATASTEYGVTACSSMTVVKGTPCVLAVTFDPYTGTGKDDAVLIVTDDAAKSPQIVKLAGVATGPTVTPPATATPTPTATPTAAATPTPVACTVANEGTVCTDPGTTCQSGACACTVSTDTDCGPLGGSGCTLSTCTGCTDTTTDNNNCGSCGTVCPSGQSCVSSTCTTVATPVPCTTASSDCQTLGADPGTTCVSGSCVCGTNGVANTAETDCGSTDGCQDLTTSSTDCGTCGNACNASGDNGACVASTCEQGTPTPAATPTPNGAPILAPNIIPPLGGVAEAAIGSSASYTITLSNDQPDSSLTLTAINITVTSPLGATPEWSETDTCGINPAGTATLTPEGTGPTSQCKITVTFAPTVGGVQIASLSIASDFTGSAPAAELNGFAPAAATPTPTTAPGGVGPGTPPVSEIAIAPSVIYFGAETVGVASGPQDVTVTNHASVPLVMASPAETITGPFAIGATDTCEGVTLESGASCVLSLTFTPTGPNEASGSVRLLDNASGGVLSSQAVELYGSGTFSTAAPTSAPPGQSAGSTISKSSLSFGAVEVGNTSAAMSVKITSTSAIPLVISTVTITSSEGAGVASQFATEADNCTGETLDDGQSCTVSVTFTPTAAGSFQGSLVFNDNVPFSLSNPQSVALSGTGYSPAASPSPAPTNSIQL